MHTRTDRTEQLVEILQGYQAVSAQIKEGVKTVLCAALDRNSDEIMGTVADSVIRMERSRLAVKLKELSRSEMQGKDIRRGLYALIGELECTE